MPVGDNFIRSLRDFLSNKLFMISLYLIYLIACIRDNAKNIISELFLYKWPTLNGCDV